MIGSAYKKFAAERGLKCSNGICYGELNGFMVTLSEGRGYKDIYISAQCGQDTCGRLMAEADVLKKKYKLNAFEVNSKFVYIAFLDGVGTLKRIVAFVDEFMPQLREYGVGGAEICPECGGTLDSGCVTKLIYGHAVKLHSGCAEEIINQMRDGEEQAAEVKSNAGMGIIGAVLFGIVGAIPWAIVYALGWFVGWLGALIGFMVVKGYEKFGGNIKKSVIPVFAVIVILCVIFAQFLGDAFQLGYYIQNGEIYGTFADIPSYIKILLEEEPEYRASVIKNIIIGLIFAALGVYGLFRSLISSVSSHSKRIVDLEN